MTAPNSVMKTKDEPPMRRFRFSIRGLMLAVVIAAALSWIGRREIDPRVWPLLVVWPTVIGMTIRAIDQMGRENPGREIRLICMILMAITALAGVVLLLPILSLFELGRTP